MFEKQSDYDTFVKLATELYDTATNGEALLRLITSFRDSVDEKGTKRSLPEADAEMNGIMAEIFRAAIRNKHKILVKHIIEKYKFTRNGPDLHELSFIQYYIEQNQTKYTTKFIDSLILTIYDKYKVLEYYDGVHVIDNFLFSTNWLLLFHFPKVKNYVDLIFENDEDRIIKVVTTKRSLISPKHMPIIEQKNVVFDIMSKYLTGENQDRFFKKIKKHGKQEEDKRLQKFMRREDLHQRMRVEGIPEADIHKSGKQSAYDLYLAALSKKKRGKLSGLLRI